MNTINKSKRFWILSFLVVILFTTSCRKANDDATPGLAITTSLLVEMPLAELRHESYYQIPYQSRSLQFVFNDELLLSTSEENILLSDNSGNLLGECELSLNGSLMTMDFNNDFQLKGGWSYYLNLSHGLQSNNGYSISSDTTIEIRTSSVHLDDLITSKANAKGEKSDRYLIAAISDVHCGDERSIVGHYSWFDENAEALTAFVEYIGSHPNIKELVIQGDLFDEWLVPYNVKPFDTAIGIRNSSDYYHAIAEAPLNKPFFDALREVVNEGLVEVIYIPGNHDMFITQEILSDIVPGIIWKSDAPGLGMYKPVDEILMEHGHRYDFFNCPQPLVTPGHMLPPGYFVTRMYASGMYSSYHNGMKNFFDVSSSFEFNTAYTLAMTYVIAQFNLDLDTIPLDANIIQMTGIDNFTAPASFDGARIRYAANIEDNWHDTQVQNNVPHPMTVFLAILNGEKLYGAALFEYLTAYFSYQPKIISWGHSHDPEIKVFPFENWYTGIYANSGSWVNSDQTKNKTRTFLIINPGSWSGSDLDVVTLYQFNPSGDGTSYVADRISEESIKR